MNPDYQLEFEKWSGAGNDFVLVENSALPAGSEPAALARGLCPRGLSVGADGLIVMDGEATRCWNPDGSEAAFCGNGARCVGGYLLERTRSEEVRFRLGRVASRAWRAGGEIGVIVPAPRFLARGIDTQILAAGLGDQVENLLDAAWIDAGVPHLVLHLARESTAAIEAAGPALRGHKHFSPGGTNVDLLWCEPPVGRRLGGSIRTWERGVEGETLACGTGAVAAALLAFSSGEVGAIDLRTRGGCTLRVERAGDEWVLRGPAQRVYRAAAPRPQG